MRLSNNNSANNEIYIGLGSNLGDCRDNLLTAVSLIEDLFQAKAILSEFYRSEPVELIEQPWFLNQVARFEPGIDILPTQTLKILKHIEEEMGRKPGVRYGPRLIDLDLLLYRDWVFESSFLTIPHPKIEERAFVLMPLVELEPELINPRTGERYQDILAEKQNQLSFCEKIENF